MKMKRMKGELSLIDCAKSMEKDFWFGDDSKLDEKISNHLPLSLFFAHSTVPYL